MHSDAWLSSLDTRLADQLRFLVEIDRPRGVVRANRIGNTPLHEQDAAGSHVAAERAA